MQNGQTAVINGYKFISPLKIKETPKNNQISQKLPTKTTENYNLFKVVPFNFYFFDFLLLVQV